jgi:hypothetical protein
VALAALDERRATEQVRLEVCERREAQLSRDPSAG